MKINTEPRSDQWNADDFIDGPRDFTIAGVKIGTAEQKYDIELVEGEGRVWRPPLTVLRLLKKAWGDDGKVWAGRRVRLFTDESVTFGRDKVGGIRVSHLSHIDGPVTAMLSESKAKKRSHTAQPLPDAPAAPVEPTEAEVAACTDVDQLKAMWRHSSPERRTQIEARVADLNNEPGAEQ